MIDTTYQQWYLQDLTQTQQTQAQKSVQRQAQTKQVSEESSARRFDKVEFSSDAIDALQKRLVEKTRENAETQSYSQTTKTAESVAERTVNAFKQEPQTLTDKALEKAQSEDKFHIGLLDLIKSGTIEIPEKKTAPQIDFSKISQKSEIKPVDRDVTNVETAADESSITVTGAQNETPKLQSTARPETVETIEKRTDISAPATKEKLNAVEERSEDSATLNTTDEIQQKQTAAKVTPSQQQGIQAYQRIQSYTNPYQMSLNAANSVA